MRLRLGTRGSDLATTQTGWVASRLEEHGNSCELVIIKTQGDLHQDVPFAQVGAPGVFVRELETALLDDRVEVAVHSYKDLPSVSPDGLVVAAVPERRDPADVVLASPQAVDRERPGLPLRHGARVGTASARRRALIENLRPDLVVQELRGNVPTRVRRVQEGAVDAVLLAASGLGRLRGAREDGRQLTGDLVEIRLDPLEFVPAPTQGALAVQVRRDREDVLEQACAIDVAGLRAPLAAERAVLRLIEGGCQVPLGVHGIGHDDGMVELHAVLGTDGGLRRASGRGTDVEALALEVYRQLVDAAGGDE